MCWCHTGVWDFGHTGVTITEAKAIYHENVTQFISISSSVKTNSLETSLDMLQKRKLGFQRLHQNKAFRSSCLRNDSRKLLSTFIIIYLHKFIYYYKDLYLFRIIIFI